MDLGEDVKKMDEGDSLDPGHVGLVKREGEEDGNVKKENRRRVFDNGSNR